MKIESSPVIKMSSREYRDSYLTSELWMSIRDKVIKRDPVCMKCGVSPSTDVHHMRYRNIVNIRNSDLVGLCRPCHSFIEKCKKTRMMPKVHNLQKIREITPESIGRVIKKRRETVILTESLLKRVCECPPPSKRRICGIMKLSPQFTFMEWVGIKTTQQRLNKIIGAIKRSKNLPKKVWRAKPLIAPKIT